MQSILPFDELNSFTEKLRGMFPDGRLQTGGEAKQEEEDIIDEMLDLFLLAYATGNTVTNANLSFDWNPTVDDATAVVNKEVAGKTWRTRVEEYFSKARNGEIPITSTATGEQPSGKVGLQGQDTGSGQVNLTDAIIRIAETETHRIANTSALDTATRAGARTKTWVTMLDDRVRETHDYLEGMTVGVKEDFYTFDGDHASAPGLFSLPENNINCRCELVFS